MGSEVLRDATPHQTRADNGVLTVKLPKRAESQPKKIAIKSGVTRDLKPGRPS